MFQLAIVGKTNSGKSTFFSAATLVHAEIGGRPFVTIKPNRGLAYLRAKCPCKEFDVKCQPKNSRCEDGLRLIPIDVMDVAGLVPGAHLGKGLGNQFLDDLIRADALIHVVDAAGATDDQGNPTEQGTHDPIDDVKFFEEELDYWLLGILKRGLKGSKGRVRTTGDDPTKMLHGRLGVLGISEESLHHIVKDNPINLEGDDQELLGFITAVRKVAKPISVAANKMDLHSGADNIERMRNAFPDTLILPVCAEAELALRRADEHGLIEYIPGASDFDMNRDITEAQASALNKIRERILSVFGSTGVQEVIDRTVYDFLKMIIVYPVANHTHLTDTTGNVLPDAFIVPEGTTARELAYRVHTDIGDKFIGAVDARSKRKLGEDHPLQDGDVVEILTSR
ncbi:MAG: redox-regulated ATPase YchF [Theionarchaea archaeon]|nr:redox-regulated ATPase YchF [Theionarchaea archaeon]